MTRRRLLLLLGPALSLLAGCAGMRAEFARQSTLERELDAYVIPKPLPEVWKSVTIVNGPHDALLWSGLAFTWDDAGEWRKRTNSQHSEDKGLGDVTKKTTWFECRGQSVPGGSQIRYVQVTATTTTRNGAEIGTDKREERRVDLELELVKHFDPAAAQRMKRAGDDAAKSANK